MRQRGWKSCSVCCVWSLVGRKNTPWLGQHYSSPQTLSMSWSLTVSGKKMADKEEWEEMKQEACVSPLGPPPSCYIHSLFFTVDQKKKKRKNLCVFECVRACVTSYPHKRFCILSALFILPFIWTVLFSDDHLMSCPGLSRVGMEEHSRLISYGYVPRPWRPTLHVCLSSETAEVAEVRKWHIGMSFVCLLSVQSCLFKSFFSFLFLQAEETMQMLELRYN